jgi:hypothetical protein
MIAYMVALAVLGGLVAVPALLALASILNGWVLVWLWRWFIIPTFHLSDLSMAYAIGIALTITFLARQVEHCKHKDEDKGTGYQTVVALGEIVLRPLLALCIGWIVHQFV